MSKPGLLFYCQHSVGIGHLVRSLALVEALSASFDVVLLSGGAVPRELIVPAGVRLVPLPPLGHDDGYALVSRDPRWTAEEAARVRLARVLAELQTVQPAVVIVELYPFGRRKFAFELLPLLEASRALPRRPTVLSSVRDILVSSRRDQARHDEQASVVANRWFDGVLVHSDPRFARLEESFTPRTPLAVPVHYTGFVGRRSIDRAGDSVATERRVFVSAGGGLVGGELFAIAVEAAPVLLGDLGLRTTIVAGPFLPVAERDRLEQAITATPGCRLVRFVPDLAHGDGRLDRVGESVRLQHRPGHPRQRDTGGGRPVRGGTGGRAADSGPPARSARGGDRAGRRLPDRAGPRRGSPAGFPVPCRPDRPLPRRRPSHRRAGGVDDGGRRPRRDR